MADKNKKPVQPVVKPYLKGSPTDERTLTGALGFFGTLIIVTVMVFLVCSMLNMKNDLLRGALCAVVELLELTILYSRSVSKGAEGVARGEILWQRQEKGLSFSDSERAICYHPMKGFMTALLGTIPFLICAILLAILAKRQTTGIGTLPTWLDGYMNRSEIGGALAAYTSQGGIGAEDILRLIVRVTIMPFVSLVGAENREGMLLLERLSPLLTLLPACAYGFGYLQGPKERIKVHTGIAESNRKRARREKRERKARIAPKPKTPEQLN